MQVRLLGPVDVLADDGPRAVQGLRRKAVLAALALHGGEVVSAARLVDVVWGNTAPPTAATTLQNHVSHLRGVLGSRTAIQARAPGYVLEVGADGTDVRVAERLLRQASSTAEPSEAVRQLSHALGLWRGKPLADVTGLDWLERQAERLDLLRVRVERALFEARLGGGEHAAVVPGLERMVASHPLDEQVHALLMLALYRSGRQADALAAYHRLRETLAGELGIDPSQSLRELEMSILRQDPALALPAAPAVAASAQAPQPAAGPGPVPTPPQVPVPAQLPPALHTFAGRAAELASLDSLLPEGLENADGPGTAAQPGEGATAGGAGRAGTVVISAISGTAGVGKTALAVTWGHRVARHFPDGQLYVNLRGFDPSGPPLEPAEAVRGFLGAFGVPDARIPAGLPAQVALYRSMLAGKRVLVVLDNARDAEQARPLLPGSPGCLAIVTSRNQLSGLVAVEGAHPVSLDLLSAADARELLTRRLGAARVSSEPEAVARIIDRCARLPLALTIAAARAATSPHFPLAAIASELQEASRTLDPFGIGSDRATDARAVFSWSYHALTPAAARLFRLLGLHPGPGTCPITAASIAGIPPGQARAQLAELNRAHLIDEPTPGRYGFHDLLRAYAAELAHSHDSPEEHEAATRRLLDHYLHTGRLAVTLMEPYPYPIELPGPHPGALTIGLATASEAMDWFATEHASLLGAVHLAADHGLPTHAWQLTWTLTTFHLRRGLWDEEKAVCYTALAAVRRAADVVGEAHILHFLGMSSCRSGRFADAAPLLQQSLRLFETVGDYYSQAAVHGQFCWLEEHRKRPDQMLSHSLRAMELYRKAGHLGANTLALNDVGYSYALLGEYQLALDYCERSLAAIRELGTEERSWEASTLHSLGFIHQQLGNYQRAVNYYEQSAALSRDLADRFNEADTLSSLGELHRSAGDEAAARLTLGQALRLFDEIGHPEGDRIRALLLPQARRLPVAAACECDVIHQDRATS